MRRDMTLVRRILKTVNESPGPVGIDQLVNDGDSREKVGEHIRLMREAGLLEAGLLEARILAADGDPFYSATVTRLTWEGHDYLAAVGASDVWRTVQEEGARAGLELTLDTAKALAAKAIERKLGLD